jgi:hypothetical protein
MMNCYMCDLNFLATHIDVMTLFYRTGGMTSGIKVILTVGSQTIFQNFISIL